MFILKRSVTFFDVNVHVEQKADSSKGSQTYCVTYGNMSEPNLNFRITSSLLLCFLNNSVNLVPRISHLSAL